MQKARTQLPRLGGLGQLASSRHHVTEQLIRFKTSHRSFTAAGICTEHAQTTTAFHRDLFQAVWRSTALPLFSSALHTSLELGGLMEATTCCEIQHRLVSKQCRTMCISQQDFAALQLAEPVILHISADLTEPCSTQLVLLEAARTASLAQTSCFLPCVQQTAPVLGVCSLQYLFCTSSTLTPTRFRFALAVSTLTLQ